ncbi:hypothetical protein D3C78_1426120 [compost metagenome]
MIVHQQARNRLALFVEQLHGRWGRFQICLVGLGNRRLHLLIELQQLTNLVRIERRPGATVQLLEDGSHAVERFEQLRGLAQLDHPGFEIVEVVEGGGQAARIGHLILWIEVGHRAGAEQKRASADFVQVLHGLRISPD